ncbi:DM13 domain-containing protein [Paraferrimonas sedimenticola]|uniref:DM13 domain-containing protein n=1 Tax=Paraferrimonas sedimenticola TaxID=375674 RepID=A0AA37VWX7_9GAMM|nr:DM13 domain-containing protein [Paraferrimonas sedimenticola]GLP95110.1 hypothetical protein GCM10007895_04160 [Paraferrimonas sedimenticola]
MKSWLGLLVSHSVVLAIGFALGIYMLPILIAPEAPSDTQVTQDQREVWFEGRFKRDLKDSDPLHWGEGVVLVGPHMVSLLGDLAPGPDYQLYLSPTFVETEADFNALKSSMQHVGPVKTFNNFSVSVPEGVDVREYSTVIVWCETFSQFISAASYQDARSEPSVQ